MASSTATRRLAAPPEPSTPDQLAASILTLLAAIERHPAGAPAALAFRSALTRKGREIAAAGGSEALADMLARIRAADPDWAEAREAVITAAWADLTPGSTSV
ncbi:MAG: hypothetical protein INR70_38480 [Parafilimonas terrae]|nr:hypothetical protein [Parafilimonas terrae]